MIRKITSHKLFLKLLKESLSGFKNRIILLFIFMLIVTAINIFLPYYFGQISERIIKKEVEVNIILFLSILYVIKLIIQYLVSFNTNYLSSVISLRLKKILIEKYIHSGSIHTDFIKSGDFHQRVFNETGSLQGRLIFGSIHFFKDLIFFLLILINLYLISPLLFINLLIFSFLIYFFHSKIGSNVSSINNKKQLENANLSSFFLELLVGKNDIIIFNLYNRVIEVVNKIENKIKRLIKTNSFYKGLSDIFLEIIILFFIASIVLILIQQKLPISEIITTIGFIAMTLWPLKGINDHLMSLNTILPSINRVEEVLKKMDGNNVIKDKKIIHSQNHISLEIKDLSYCYSDKIIFDKFSFLLREGVYLISGQNGAGKSTLAKLILGILTMDKGEIIMNVKNANNAVGLVSQTPFLYNNTIRENLKINNSITNEQINFFTETFLDKNKLHLNLDKIVGENGGDLSGGEKQLISILRGLIMNPDILILDEITNNLPNQIYENIIQKIVGKREGLITIIISHQIIKSIKFNKIIKI